MTVDVAWDTGCIDKRCYDYAALAEVCDALFVMDYDTRSQILGPCIASANSPLWTAQQGISDFLKLGIPASKLYLGVPWYGRDYPCVHPTNETVCPIAKIPFRGVECSDSPGDEINYDVIMDWLEHNATAPGRHWDAQLESPWFNYVDSKGTRHQLWYDDPQSLSLKMRVAHDHALGGVGVWQIDAVDYHSTSERVRAQTTAMWATFDVFLHGP